MPSVQFSSVTQSCPTLCDPMEFMPGLPVHHQLPELTQTHVHWVSDAIQQSHPWSSPSPPLSIFPSIRVFSNESVLCIKWPKYWSFSFSISSSREHSGLISFGTDWLDFLAVQGHTSFCCVLFYLCARALHRYYLLLIESLWQALVEQTYQCHFSNSILYSCLCVRVCVIL